MRNALKTVFFSVGIALAVAATSGSLVTLNAHTFGMGDHSTEGGVSCPMLPGEHLAWWDSLFAAVSCGGVSLPVATLFSITFISIISLVRVSFFQPMARAVDPPLPLENFIVRGRLQPKHCA